MGAESELRIKHTTVGAEEAARNAEQVAAAQGKITAQVSEQAPAVEKAAESQKKLNAGAETYISLLSRIHPALGAFADAMLKGAKVAGDLATQQISLRGAVTAAATAMRNFAGAIGLTLAGGAVAAGFLAISRAIASIREEEERARASIRRQGEALDEQREKYVALEQQIRKTADARLRFAALGAEESEQAAQQAQRVAKKAGVSLEAAGDIVGQFAGSEATEEELVKAARLAAAQRLPELGRTDDPGTRLEKLRFGIRENEEFLGAAAERDRGDFERKRRRALQVSRSEGGGKELEQFIRDLPGDIVGSMDPARLAKLIQGQQAVESRGGVGIGTLGFRAPLSGAAHSAMRAIGLPMEPDLVNRGIAVGREAGVGDASSLEMQVVDRLLRILETNKGRGSLGSEQLAAEEEAKLLLQADRFGPQTSATGRHSRVEVFQKSLDRPELTQEDLDRADEINRRNRSRKTGEPRYGDNIAVQQNFYPDADTMRSHAVNGETIAAGMEQN